MYGTRPYDKLKNAEVVVKVQAGYRHPQPSGCSRATYNLLLSCWEEEPTDRPTFAALVLALDTKEQERQPSMTPDRSSTIPTEFDAIRPALTAQAKF